MVRTVAKCETVEKFKSSSPEERVGVSWLVQVIWITMGAVYVVVVVVVCGCCCCCRLGVRVICSDEYVLVVVAVVLPVAVCVVSLLVATSLHCLCLHLCFFT